MIRMFDLSNKQIDESSKRRATDRRVIVPSYDAGDLIGWRGWQQKSAGRFERPTRGAREQTRQQITSIASIRRPWYDSPSIWFGAGFVFACWLVAFAL